ncbi:MAG: hypothetical protein K2H43_04440, partial [Clostridia bacterium]|nr:hypothetical protein [Clostridia bacterium]
MRDEAGNEAEGSYKIIAQAASVQPMIDVPALFVVWKGADGKVKVPQANIVHDLPVTLSVTVKDGESIVPVENGAFVAEKSQYTLCYTATDSRGVTAESETRLLINERGVINSFGTAGEESLWGADARLQDGKLYLESSASEAVFTYGEFFECNDWQGSKSLKLTLQNNRTADAVVRVQVNSGGVWKELSSFLLGGATANEDLERVLPAAAECLTLLGGVERAEGIRLVVACSGGVNIAVDEIALSDLSEELPSGTQSGFAAGNYTVEGNGSVYAAVEAEEPAAGQNAVQLGVYSTARAEVRIGLIYEQETIYARAVLEAGANSLLRVPELESADVRGALKGIVIDNLESYPVSVQLSGTRYAQVTSVEDCRVGGAFAVEYGDTFTVPNPFTADDRYYENLQAELVKEGERVRTVAVGERLQNIKDKADALEAGAEYLLRYTYTDGVSGETCTAEYPLLTLKHTLSFSVDIPVLYLSDEAQTVVNIESDVY